jgi:ABC-2 type transport system ATP-binding protein
MLLVRNLYKTYDKVVAVNNINFEANKGEITVLLGPNGAGKSTAIKCICGLLRYNGDITIGGYKNKSSEARRVFSYVPETPSLYEMLTVYEHLEFIAKVYNLVDYKSKIEELLVRFELADKRDKLGKELSKGMQQKVSICCGLLTNPGLIFFDEPMVGLDPRAIKELKEAITELRNHGACIFISTHIIDSIDELWDKAMIMKDGRIAAYLDRKNLTDESETLENLFFRVTEGG